MEHLLAILLVLAWATAGLRLLSWRSGRDHDGDVHRDA